MADRKTSEPARKRRFSPLALIPVGVALALGPLMLPRAVAPTTLPVPMTDTRAFDARVTEDQRRARRAELERLPDDARLVGQAIRDLNVAAVNEDKTTDWEKLRRGLDMALATVRATPNGNSVLLDLRAVQLEHFLAAVRDFERTGQTSKELDELGGPFVKRLRLAGWLDDHTVLMAEPERRVAFKLAWNALTLLENLPDFDPSLDEMRVLYTFYLQNPHAADPVRAQIDAHRRAAKTKKECDALDAGERLAAEAWRLEKIDKLAKIDPIYPAEYARGVELFRLARYADSARAFERWLDAHPNGAFTLRARGHLRAAIRAKEEAP